MRFSGVSTYRTKLAGRVPEDFSRIVTPKKRKMIQKSCAPPARVPIEIFVRDIRRATRNYHSAEDKNLINRILT
jgi:hypothetical protein